MMTSVAEMCHLYLPGMQERAYGRVVNVASVAGLVMAPGGANYGPAKAYVVRLSEELAMLAKPHGVHVTALCPGFTHTEFHDVGGLRAMKSGLPNLLWYPAAVVVQDGRKAVEAGKSVQVSGRLYRVLVPLLRFGVIRKIACPLATPLTKTGGCEQLFEISDEGVAAALASGASYADARVVIRREQAVSGRNGAIEGLRETESAGVGVRALVGSSWGFFATEDLTAAGARMAGRQAAAIALASSTVPGRPLELAAVPAVVDTYETPHMEDPFRGFIDRKGRPRHRPHRRHDVGGRRHEGGGDVHVLGHREVVCLLARIAYSSTHR